MEITYLALFSTLTTSSAVSSSFELSSLEEFEISQEETYTLLITSEAFFFGNLCTWLVHLPLSCIACLGGIPCFEDKKSLNSEEVD